jgi:acetyl-CoA carboxylase carboxyl transferase subunit beta
VKKKSQEGSITYQNRIPFIMISKSGGARMMEAAYSLMQLKNICKLAQLAEEKIPYISLCTDPTTEERLHLMLC